MTTPEWKTSGDTTDESTYLQDLKDFSKIKETIISRESILREIQRTLVTLQSIVFDTSITDDRKERIDGLCFYLGELREAYKLLYPAG